MTKITNIRGNEFNITAEKEKARELFRRWDALQLDPRQHDEGSGVYDRNSPQSKWLADTDPLFYEIIRMYIRHLASEAWLFNTITQHRDGDDAPSFDSVDGERLLFEELREWAADR